MIRLKAGEIDQAFAVVACFHKKLLISIEVVRLSQIEMNLTLADDQAIELDLLFASPSEPACKAFVTRYLDASNAPSLSAGTRTAAIKQIETGDIWPSQAAAVHETGVHKTSLSKHLKGVEGYGRIKDSDGNYVTFTKIATAGLRHDLSNATFNAKQVPVIFNITPAQLKAHLSYDAPLPSGDTFSIIEA